MPDESGLGVRKSEDRRRNQSVQQALSKPQSQQDLRKIYIVVPVYNRKALVERFLDCVSGQTFPNYKVIIVDDGSTDGTSEMIMQKYPAVEVVQGDGNLWWTGATNVGIRRAMVNAAPEDAVLIINDDLEFDSGYLWALYRAWQSTPNALIGSVLVDIREPDRIYSGGERVNWWTAKWTSINPGRRLGEFGQNYQIDVSVLTGRGALMPIHFLRRAGLFDDVHFQQCGDTELPGRARKHGYRTVVSYDAVLKLHTAESATINVSECYVVGDLVKYLFDIKSNFRLKYRFFFAYNTATNPFAFLSFLTLDLVRITVHFIRGWRRGRQSRAATV